MATEAMVKPSPPNFCQKVRLARFCPKPIVRFDLDRNARFAADEACGRKFSGGEGSWGWAT